VTDGDRVLPGGVATGVGSMPGVDPREAAAEVVGELPDLPHVAELPARGPGADMVGRAAGLLVDLHVDVQPSGWRLVDRPGLDERRARSYLGQDLDELEAHADGYAGPVKLQVTGPWTLAAALQLPRGEPVLTDAGAVRDVAGSLAEGVAAHVAELRARLPGAEPVLQLDEPSLPAVLAGAVRTSSGARTVSPVPEPDAEQVLREVLAAAAAAGALTVVHCCAARPPVDLVRRAGARGVSLDLTLVGVPAYDALGEAVEAGLTLLAGVVPTSGPADGAVSDVRTTVDPVRRLWRRLGLGTDRMARQVVVTPTCGLAGASPAYARAAMTRAREAARALTELEVE
jgi:methionine synthase II (cobalamin-independent)